MWYLLGARVVELGRWEAGAAEEEPTAGLAVGAVAAVAAIVVDAAAAAAGAAAKGAAAAGAAIGGAAAARAAGLEPPARKGRNGSPKVKKRGLRRSLLC